jgi:hypothetical protein
MKQRIIIDTNLLLLLVVGTYNPAFISDHKRTDTFTEEDFDLLAIVIDGCDLIFTPNICTEVSNLLWQTSEPHKTDLRRLFSKMITRSKELYHFSSLIVDAAEFLELGLTDAGVLELPEGSGTILTVDLDLHLAALARGIPTENFNNYRRF